jgi:hypothetical protein
MTTPRDWLDTLGAGVKVFCLDSGLEGASFVRPVAARTFVGDGMADPIRHGTRMAEIIASADPLDPGVAPACDLYVAKVISHHHATRPIAEALAWALESGADVVSMSFAYRGLDADVLARLEELDAAGCICLAAWHASLTYPHSHPCVLSCGSLGGGGDPDVRTVAEVMRRAPASQLRPYRGNSVATAHAAGIAACGKALMPRLSRPGFAASLATPRGSAGGRSAPEPA